MAGGSSRAGEAKEEKGLLPKRNRIKSEKEIKELSRTKQFHITSQLFSIIAGENHLGRPRITVICRKVIGNAVKRNWARRKVIAECLKIWRNNGKNIDILVYPRDISNKERFISEIERGLKEINEKNS